MEDFDGQNLPPVVMAIVPLFDMVHGRTTPPLPRNNMAILVRYVEIREFTWLLDDLYFSN